MSGTRKILRQRGISHHQFRWGHITMIQTGLSPAGLPSQQQGATRAAFSSLVGPVDSATFQMIVGPRCRCTDNPTNRRSGTAQFLPLGGLIGFPTRRPRQNRPSGKVVANLHADLTAGSSNSVQPQDNCLSSASTLPLQYYCRIEKNEKVRFTCFRFRKECFSGTCRHTIEEVEDYPRFTKKPHLDEVVRSLDEYPGMDATVYCYFYKEDNFNCVISRHYTNTAVDIEALQCKYADRCVLKQCSRQKQS
ncbi:hypothetical protein BV898_18882 [Hypsibius exemplaris]|uniref:Uncharacterized protein n=1 Tax=Hypsibius exemplaris TaxID=2072580 RepID=A0A9X6NHQ8_HYPEX|nr:hypothetical protein BV898_18882 [Hypsibius exemplaris]